LDIQKEGSGDSFDSKSSLLEQLVNNGTTHTTSVSPRRAAVPISSPTKESHKYQQKQEIKTGQRSLSTTRTTRRRPTPVKFNTGKIVQSVDEIQSSLRRSPHRKKKSDKSTVNNNNSDNTSLSKESWIPLNVRMKMLRRNMAVAKINTETRRQYDDVYGDLDRQDTVTEELERSKRNDILTRRTRKKLCCALCEMNFTAKNLSYSVSYKAIMDIRLSWGVEIPPDPRYSRFPHWYKPVQVCVFCSQFFQREGGLFDSPERGVLKREQFSDNDKQTLVDMGLRSRSPQHKRNTVLMWSNNRGKKKSYHKSIKP